MTAKEFLEQARSAERSVQSIFEEVQRLRDLATNISPVYGKEAVSHSRSADRIPNAIERVMEAEERMNAEIDRMLIVKEEVRNVIARVPDPEQRFVLEQRYLNFHSWSSIAMEIGKQLRWTQELHGRGLVEVEKIIARVHNNAP